MEILIPGSNFKSGSLEFMIFLNCFAESKNTESFLNAHELNFEIHQFMKI
jgi:hypothetical protein